MEPAQVAAERVGGGHMKNDLFTDNGPGLKSPGMKDADADHSEDSDLLDMIGRDSVDQELSKESPKSPKRQI